MKSDVSLNSNEIDVMFFLFDRPASSAKEVVAGVTSLSSFVAFDNLITKLKRMSFVTVQRDVLYSLSELGKVLIGKTEPNDYLKKDIERRGLTGVSFKRETSYVWGSEQNNKNTDKNPAFSLLEKSTTEDQVVNSVNETGDKVDVASKDWLFSESEKQILRGENKNKEGLLSLQSRHLYVGEHMSVIGEKVLSEIPRAPYNTDMFSLTRKQRIIIEAMGHSRKGFIKLDDLRKILKNCGEDEHLDNDFKVLAEKGLIERKSNKVRYLTPLAFIGFGYRRYKKGKHESIIKNSVNGKELLRRLELTIWTEHDFDNDLGLSKIKSENENATLKESKSSEHKSEIAEKNKPAEPESETKHASLEDPDDLFGRSESDVELGEQLSFTETEDQAFSFDSEKLNSALKELSELEDKVKKGGKSIPFIKSASEKITLLDKLNEILLLAGSDDTRSVFSEIIDDYKKWDDFSKS